MLDAEVYALEKSWTQWRVVSALVFSPIAINPLHRSFVLAQMLRVMYSTSITPLTVKSCGHPPYHVRSRYLIPAPSRVGPRRRSHALRLPPSSPPSPQTPHSSVS